jgi:hypothetical protein
MSNEKPADLNFKDFYTPNVISLFDYTTGKFIQTKLDYIVAGDTDSAYCKIPDKIVEYFDSDVGDLVDFSDMIGRETNDTFPEFCRLAFNCPDSRKDVIATDREVVSNKSLFMTKKRYIMHVVDNEGVRKDKWKISGLEVKKSDTPPAVKKFLYDLLIHLVEGDDISNIEKRIDAFKEEYFTLPIQEIGIPKPAKTLYKYQKAIEASGGKMKGVPYHVKGAINYNKLCGKQDKIILPGEKFYLSYTKNPEFNLIGIPIDSQNDPEWWGDVVIDYEKMWSRAYKKIYAYLDSVDLTPTGRRKTRAKELMGV